MDDEVSPQAEFLWEYNQQMVPIQFARLLSMFFYPLFLHRFYLKQWKQGIVLITINLSCVFIYYSGGIFVLVLPVGIMLYEWLTIKKRTKAYNVELEKMLKEKWNVAPDYRIAK